MSVTYVQFFAGNDSKKPIQKAALNKLQIDFDMGNKLIEFCFFSFNVWNTIQKCCWRPLEEGRKDWFKVFHGDFYHHTISHPTVAMHGTEV